MEKLRLLLMSAILGTSACSPVWASRRSIGPGDTRAAGPPAAQRSWVSDYELHYEAPTDCPSAEALRTSIDAHVKRHSRSSVTRLDVSVIASGDGFEGYVIAASAADTTVTRSLDSQTCVDLVHGLALIAGIAIDLSSSPPAPQPTAPQPTALQPTAPQPPASRPTAPQPPAPQPTAPQPPAPQPASAFLPDVQPSGGYRGR